MSWDTPEHFQNPKERAAAEEMARRAEAERHLEDARAQTMADAVRLGFADLAAAIVCAAGTEAIEAWNSRRRFGDLAKYGLPDTGVDCGLGIDPDGFNEASAQADSDIDDLLDNQQ